MKEGSFDKISGPMSGLDFLTNQKSGFSSSVSKIATPDETPKTLDFSTLPENVMRSAVIESLIAQNDDLMARLNVTLRRIHGLEEKLHESQSETTQFRAKYDNLNDQLLVLKEQSRILAERSRETQAKNAREDSNLNELKEQIRILEIRYSELYATNSERENRLTEELESTQNKLARFQKYRRNAKRAIASIREDYSRLRSRSEFQESQIFDLRANLQESTDYIASQGKTFNQEREQLIEAYENEIANFRKQILHLEEAQRALQTRVQDYDALYNEKVQLENDLVIERRRNEDRDIESTKEIADLQKAVARHRNDAKEMAVQAASMEQQVKESTQQAAALNEQNAALNEQVENLQILWRDQQSKLEKLTGQKVALQKLNQELSQNLNQYRREIRDLKDQLDRMNHSGKSVVPTERDGAAPQIIEKIDKVLADLHSAKNSD